MTNIRNFVVFSAVSLISCASIAGNSDILSRQSTGMWSQHQGTYLGILLGFNLNKFNFYNLNTQFHTVTQELFLGHLFTPNWGLEGEVGSYFSGLGLAMRGSVKGYLPVSNRISLSADIGASYISTFLEKGFVGPYFGVSGNFFLSKQIAWTFNINDIISSYNVTPGIKVDTNFLSALTGFTYYS